jgi:hypothetical protein
MIRVNLLREIDGHGVFDYEIDGYGVQGRSRQPLLDACRQVKRMGADPADRIGLFRSGRERPDLVGSVGWGAEHTVDEVHTHFVKWRPFPEGKVR